MPTTCPTCNPSDNEITVTTAARRLAVSIGVIYYWIEVGHLTANRHAAGRIGIPWNRTIEAECRGRIYQSGHLTPKKTTRRRARAKPDQAGQGSEQDQRDTVGPICHPRTDTAPAN